MALIRYYRLTSLADCPNGMGSIHCYYDRDYRGRSHLSMAETSDDVAKSVGTFFAEKKKAKQEEEKLGSVTDPDRLLDCYAEMTLTMRQDCFEKSGFDIDDARECMPIAYSDEHDGVIVR